MAAAIACTDDDLSQGPNLQPSTDFIVGFPEAAVSYSYFADEGAVQRQFPVVLIGGNAGNPSDTPLVVNYEIVPFDAATGTGSTATEGTEFDFLDNSGQLTIPAGQDFVNFPILVNTCCLDLEVKTTLVIKLTGVTGADGIVSQNNSTFTVNFVGCQADLAGTYSVATVRESTGSVLNQVNQTITEVSTNYFLTQNTATLTPNQIGTGQGFYFNVLCGEITVPSQGLFQGVYPNEVVGVPMDSGDYAGLEGAVISDNQFKIRYKANYGGATGFVTVTSTYTRNN